MSKGSKSGAENVTENEKKLTFANFIWFAVFAACDL
jgi:hypothetical protein